MIKGKKITAPGYFVRLSEESSIDFYGGSTFAKADHPERITPEHAPTPKKKGAATVEETKAVPAETVEGEN